MILNLLRVEQLRVEDMIRRGVSEFHAQRDVGSHRQAMESLKVRMAKVKDIECYICCVDLERYYQACKEYQELKQRLQVGRSLLGGVHTFYCVCLGGLPGFHSG